jgi:membrane protein DedA with SNARE-associated domain
MLDFLMNMNPLSVYPIILFGYMIFGGFMLIPAIYLAITGTINLFYLFVTIILASICADSMWYYIGKQVKKERIYELRFLRSKVEEAKKFSDYFSKRAGFLVFICKFIYGTRIASHILAGMHKMRYLKFILAIALGTAIWFLIFYVLIKSLDIGISEAGAVGMRIQIIFFVSMSILLLINYLTSKYLRKKFFNKKK